MALQLTSNSIEEMLTSSGLLDPATVGELRQHFPLQTNDPEGFLSLLLSRNLLTEWQAKKLRLGKHRGFFLGPYQLKSHLARGGMSTLYVAEHRQTGEERALKVLPPSKAGEASYLPRFLREAELASRLQHENIMKVHDVMACTDHGQTIHFMVMELLHGRDLFQDVVVRGPLPVRDAAEVIRQSAIGLQHAHDAGLVHRDVKPGNLFLTEEGTVKIVDLGLAAIMEGQSESLTRMHDERVLGTADYLAPEQAVDSHRVDSRADIYALGCAFYYALTGQPLFTEGGLAQRILAHQTKAPPNISEVRDDVPPAIQQLLKQMLVKRRVHRIQTCREVAEQLERWLSGAEMLASEMIETSPERKQQTEPPASELRGRRLKRIKRRVAPSETPTDVIQAADNSTVTSVTLRESTPKSELKKVEFSDEFESFLEQLEGESGLASVMKHDEPTSTSLPSIALPAAQSVAQNPPEISPPQDAEFDLATPATQETRQEISQDPQHPKRKMLLVGLLSVLVTGFLYATGVFHAIWERIVQ